MNDHAKMLIRELRDSKSRVHKGFDMTEWWTREKCGSVGCLAGWAVHLLPDRVEGLSPMNIGACARKALGLDDWVSQHLFKPNEWSFDLRYGWFENEELWREHPNWRCDLDTIEKMKEWSEKIALSACIYRHIDAYKAANALEALDDHPGYVDWMEAIER